MRTKLAALTSLLAGLVAGAVLTLSIQSGGVVPAGGGTRHRPTQPPTVVEPPTTFLAWVPGGMPAGYGARVLGLPGVARVTVVAEDNTWLTRSYSAAGAVVDRPRKPYMIPIDAAAVDPGTFAQFLPPADREVIVALDRGEGVLGATSAQLRGLGPGAVMEFAGGARVRIAAVLPDQLVGAAELMVSDRTGARIGVTHDRYLLLQPDPGRPLTSRRLTEQLRPLLPRTIPRAYRKVQVRAPGETPYFRQGDAVLPPVLVKSLFGEFAARPDPNRPGWLLVDPAWVRAHIVTATVPILGEVRCNAALIPQLREAMQELQRRGLGGTIHAYDGCYAPRFINRDPTNLLSHHSWGIAFDVNADVNPVGGTPHQDPRLVQVMQRWGFVWGGSFIVPDGNHFEYRFTPTRT